MGKSTEVEPASGVVHTDMVERFDTAPSKNILDSSDNQPNTYGQRETSNVPLMIQVKGKVPFFPKTFMFIKHLLSWD